MNLKRTLLLIGGGLCLLILTLLLLILAPGGQRVLGLYGLNHNKIVFYGRLEDQFGNALPNATVEFSVRVESGFRTGVDKGTVVSDANGAFKISGYAGSRMWVVPRLEGYSIASENREAVYSSLWPENERAHPNPTNPVVIKMWKWQGAEVLVELKKVLEVHCTNEPVCFDLLKGQVVFTGGDLKVTLHRPAGLNWKSNPQPWSVTFEAVDGGVMPAAGTQRITYFSPESGYAASCTVSNRDSGLPAQGPSYFATDLYVRSRNGQVYSKLSVEIRLHESSDGPVRFTFGGVANANHSRNWEAAPHTYLTDGF